MLYWLFFIVVSIFLSYFATDQKIEKEFRNYAKILLFLFVFWFSGFRDGLGSDYLTYTDRLLGRSYLEYGIEPAFSVFANLVFYTTLSPVFFFLTMAIITNYFFLKSFFRYEYTFYIIIIYLLTPLFFFDTFNAVRSMFAASIFVYSCKYIESKNFIKYLLCILIAFTMHFSALLLLPFYFIGRKDFKKILLTITLVLSYIIGSIIKISIDALLIKIIPFYAIYTFRDTQHEGTGILNIIFNLILLLLIYKKQLITTSTKNLIAFNLFFIGIVLSNFMPSFYYITRVAMYFIVFGAIVIPMLINIFDKKLMKVSIVVLFLLLFSNFLFRYINDKSYVPNKILPIESLVDK